MFNDFAHAWRLLTAIPLPIISDDYDRPAGKATAYFPLVGLLLGVILAGVGYALSLGLSNGVAATLTLALWAAMTGFLHLDGFMDACDGLLPPRKPDRRLEIMKDSRVGAFGVIGAMLLLLLKFNGIAALLIAQQVLPLILIPVLGRWTMTLSMAFYPPARNEGLGVFFKQGLGRFEMGLASLVALGSALILGWPGLILLLGAGLIMAIVARFAIARIGGLTGDIYGTICELVEAGLLVIVVLFLRAGLA